MIWKFIEEKKELLLMSFYLIWNMNDVQKYREWIQLSVGE